jgi:hypothetical protein
LAEIDDDKLEEEKLDLLLEEDEEPLKELPQVLLPGAPPRKVSKPTNQKEIQTKCLLCESLFMAARRWTKFCSKDCRILDHYRTQLIRKGFSVTKKE